MWQCIFSKRSDEHVHRQPDSGHEFLGPEVPHHPWRGHIHGCRTTCNVRRRLLQDTSCTPIQRSYTTCQADTSSQHDSVQLWINIRLTSLWTWRRRGSSNEWLLIPNLSTIIVHTFHDPVPRVRGRRVGQPVFDGIDESEGIGTMYLRSCRILTTQMGLQISKAGDAIDKTKVSFNRRQ